MKLTTMTQVTVDGVMQGNGGASDEDRRNGFERGGWALGAGDDETMTLINETYRRADAFLFGRRTYELFAGYWGAEERTRAAAEDPGSHPIAAALNARPKYLVSTTLTDPRWAPTTLLTGDLAAAAAFDRQLLEYAVAYGADGVVLVDPENGLVREVDFALAAPPPAPEAPARLPWFIAGAIAAGVVSTVLSTVDII